MERETERGNTKGGGRGMEGDKDGEGESHADSMLGVELHMGIDLTTLGSWLEGKSGVTCLTS